MPQLVESNVWRVELNPNQQHLGRVFVGLREHKPSLGELSDADMVEYLRIVRSLELGIRGAFGANLFNWMSLQNNAVRDGQEPHVHWHGVPRYDHPVEFDGHRYTDSAWPRQYNTGSETPYKPDRNQLDMIGKEIMAHISKSLS